jgi:hypothetical protein
MVEKENGNKIRVLHVGNSGEAIRNGRDMVQNTTNSFTLLHDHRSTRSYAIRATNAPKEDFQNLRVQVLIAQSCPAVATVFSSTQTTALTPPE